jgi:hypothetical protein
MTTASASLTDADRKALAHSFELTLAEPDRTEQIERKLETDGALATAMFASYHQQMAHLRLRPWQSPPCWIGSGANIDPEVAEIGKRLERLGLSQFEPDPIGAIEQAKARGGHT